jgi:hypothetical protein
MMEAVRNRDEALEGELEGLRFKIPEETDALWLPMRSIAFLFRLFQKRWHYSKQRS